MTTEKNDQTPAQEPAQELKDEELQQAQGGLPAVQKVRAAAARLKVVPDASESNAGDGSV